MSEHKVLTKLLEVHDLPTLPTVLTKILEAVADEESSAADLTEILEQDHAISARILRLANSAFYGLRQHVESIRAGVVVLGFDEVQNLALATSVFDTFAKRRQFALDPEDFWMHSLGTAKAVQILVTDYCRVDSPEGCYTAGLLHDIGKYVLALVLKGEYAEIVAEAQSSGQTLGEVESERLGTSHTKVGRWLAEKWRFPPLIVHILGNLDRVGAYSGEDKSSVAVVALADRLSMRTGFGFAGESELLPTDRHPQIVLGLEKAQLDEAAGRLASLQDETYRFITMLQQAG